MSDLELFKSFIAKDKRKLPQGNNAIIYTRVSHSSQEDNTSLESQKKYCELFAQRKGLDVVAYFGGTYESAKTDDRKVFNRMLAYLKKTKTISTIIVYSYERFSRSGMHGAQIAEDLLKLNGIVTLAVTQELDPTTASGSFQQQIFFLFSKMDNEIRRDKTVTGMTELIRKGVVPYTIPRGYTNTNKGARAIDQKLEINQEGMFLKKAFEMKHHFNYSDALIVKKLKLLGYTIDPRRLGTVFRNPFYCGVIVSKLIPNEIIQGKHKALISKNIFLSINNIKSEKISPNSIRSNDSESLPLKRFLKCSVCNESLTGFIVKKKNIYYYKCRTNTCHSTRNASIMHQKFEEIIKEFTIDEDLVEPIKVKIKELFQSKFENKIEENSLIKRKIKEQENKVNLIEERFVLGEIDKDLFSKFSKKLKYEKEELEQQLSNSKINSSNLEKCIDFALKLCKNPFKIWSSGNLEQRKKLQTLMFPEGMKYDKKNDLVQTTRINEIFLKMLDISKVLKETKNGEPILKNQFSVGVTSSRFKLETSTAVM